MIADVMLLKDELHALGHDVELVDASAVKVNNRYLVQLSYPFWNVFRWDKHAQCYGGPAGGDWEFIGQAHTMRSAERMVTRG